MFKKILVALDHSRADNALLPRVEELARLTNAEILLLHVSTGWAAQWQDNLNLADSEEMRGGRQYLEETATRLSAEGFRVSTRHDAGKPSDAILKAAREEHCDLIAMTTHGHKWLSDLIYGTTITKVRHEADTPIFLVKAARD